MKEGQFGNSVYRQDLDHSSSSSGETCFCLTRDLLSLDTLSNQNCRIKVGFPFTLLLFVAYLIAFLFKFSLLQKTPLR